METTPDGRTVLRRSAAGWPGAMITVVVIGALTTGIVFGAGVLMLQGTYGPAFLMVALSLWMLSLLIYLWRDCRAKQAWSIAIEAGEILLDLPPGRSLMAHTPGEKCRLDMFDIMAIETRLESFRSFGLSNMQRSYGLRLKSGRLVVLGEDRALATGLADETVGRMIDVMALRTGLPLRDRGMVEGKGGFLGVFFTSVPGWETPGLAAGREATLWRNASLTLGLAGMAVMAAMFLSLAL